MPNVSNSETEYTHLILGVTEGDLSGVDAILDIDNSHRPRALRGKSGEEILGTVESLLDTVSATLGIPRQSMNFTSSRNNRDGSDLLELSTGASIELKLGAATDLNVGFTAVRKHLLDDYTLLTPADRRRWRSMWAKTPDLVLREQDEQILGLVSFCEGTLLHEEVSGPGCVLVGGYVRGITNEKEIFSQCRIGYRSVYRFDLGCDGKWVYVPKLIESSREWRYESFVYSEMRRFTFRIRNDAMGRQMRFILNYKNNYRMRNGDKVPARFGLGSPSFNGWIEPASSTTP